MSFYLRNGKLQWGYTVLDAIEDDRIQYVRDDDLGLAFTNWSKSIAATNKKIKMLIALGILIFLFAITTVYNIGFTDVISLITLGVMILIDSVLAYITFKQLRINTRTKKTYKILKSEFERRQSEWNYRLRHDFQ